MNLELNGISHTTKVTSLSVIYGGLSLLMIFVNKLILQAGKSKNIISPEDLLIIQCGVSTILILMLSPILKFPISLKFTELCVCTIVNIAFIGTMLANSYTLSYLSIHMVTLLKCISVVITALGDCLFLGHHITKTIWISLFMIVCGSGLGVATDLEFSLIGYIWMFLSICFASCYVILTKILISQRDIQFFTAAFWNNLLSTFFLSTYMYLKNPKQRKGLRVLFSLLIDDDGSKNAFFLSKTFVIFSGVLGLLLNISTFSLLGETSATSYVVVGAGKKIFQAILSFIFFNASTSFVNILSVMTGLCGATLYAYEKWIESKKTELLKNDQLILLEDHKKREAKDEHVY